MHFKEITERAQCREVWRGDGKEMKRTQSRDTVVAKGQGTGAGGLLRAAGWVQKVSNSDGTLLVLSEWRCLDL